MGKKLAIEHHLISPNEVIELLEMMGGKNTDNADGCSFLYYTLYTPKINNPNNDKVICGFTNLKMQNDFFAIFTLEKFWKKYPYKLNDLVLCDDGLLGVVTKMEWDCEKSDMKYHISFKMPVDNKWYSSKNIKSKFMEAKGKRLAILGHPTRGNEVIELLKIMGGKICAFDYDSDGYAYYIDTSTNMIICSNENAIKHNLDKYQLFTLEEFWEKYPFKLGDKVIDEADGCPGVVCEMKWDEGLSDMKYCVAFGNGVDFGWFANDSINFFKIKKNENLEETQSKRDIDKAEFVIQHMILPNKMDDKLEYKIPDGLEFDVVVDGKIILKPIKPKYPKTYEECKEMMGENAYYGFSTLMTLQKLINARNAYWKIYGEEMGLGKSWEPVYAAFEDNTYFIIQSFNGEIDKSATSHRNAILAFPTIEMRDTFYENFKDLIEECKELL
jgi:bifunctional DNA-binding transcriptional regulator/antitoxin component of YhaV-PrlF toxin-antitoxin module